MITFVQCSSYSTGRLTPIRRGTGGRSSFNGIVATVFGASGLVGKAVCNRLGKVGTQMIIPYRGDYYDVQPLKMCGDLGQVLFSPYYLKDEESLRKAMKHSNLVINMIGREWETRNFSFDDIYVKGIQALWLSGHDVHLSLIIQVPGLLLELPKSVEWRDSSTCQLWMLMKILSLWCWKRDLDICRPKPEVMSAFNFKSYKGVETASYSECFKNSTIFFVFFLAIYFDFLQSFHPFGILLGYFSDSVWTILICQSL